MVILLGWNLKFLDVDASQKGCLSRVNAVCSCSRPRKISTKPNVYRKWKLNISFGDVIFGCLVNQPITTKVIDSHESCFCLKNLSQVSDSRCVDSIRARFNKNKLLWPRGSVTKRSEDIQKFGTEKWHPNQGTKIIGIHVCNIYLHFVDFYGTRR